MAVSMLEAFGYTQLELTERELGAGLIVEARAAASEGFTGKLAIHPAQVGPINDAFTPTEDELARAQAIVDAFAADPDAGVLSVAGKMVDRPHLVQARRVLARSR